MANKMPGITTKKKKSQLATLLRFGISFGAISVIFYMFRGQLPAVGRHLLGADPWYFLFALLIYFAGLLAVAFRLQYVLDVQKTRLSIPLIYYMNLVALFFNNVLPSSVGGDMVKAYYIYRHADGRESAFSAVVVDRLFGLATMVLIGLSAILFMDNAEASSKIISSVLTLAAVTVVICFFIFNQRVVNAICGVHLPFVPAVILDKLRNFYQAMHHYRGHRHIILRCMLLTLLGQLTYIFTNFWLARSLGIDISLSFFFFFVPIILIMGLTPSVNGIGVREATYLFYLTDFTSPDKALALSLMTSFFLIVVGVIGGILYAFKGGMTKNGSSVGINDSSQSGEDGRAGG